MFSLQDLLGQQQGSEAVGQISQQVGAEPSAVNSAIAAALPSTISSDLQDLSIRTVGDKNFCTFDSDPERFAEFAICSGDG